MSECHNYDSIEFLVRKAKSNKEGSEKAKIEVVESFNFLLYKNCKRVYKYLKEEYSMEDLLQIGKYSILKAIDMYDDSKHNFPLYVNRAIRNNFNDVLRKSNKRLNTMSLDKELIEGVKLEDTLSSKVNIEEEYLNKEKLQEVKKAIKTLSDKERRFLDFCLKEDKCVIKKYSKATGISYSTCAKMKSRIIKKLKKYFQSKQH